VEVLISGFFGICTPLAKNDFDSREVVPCEDPIVIGGELCRKAAIVVPT
jgi:hypothetical protein